MIAGITASTRRGGGGDPPLEIGQVFDGGFYAGDIQYPDGQWYRLVIADKSADIKERAALWKTGNTDTPGTDHLIDGVSNTDAMVAAGIELHPAAQHCVNYRGSGFEDWYMAAKDELYVLYQNLGWNGPNCPPAWQIGGSQQFVGAYYWSSTRNASGRAWMQAMGGGHQGSRYYSDSGPTARPIRRVPFTP